MIELDKVTAESFRPHIDAVFTLHSGEGALEMRLTEVTEGAYGHPERRRGFSLFFLGPKAPILPQRIYELEHASLGAMSIFLVPVQNDARGQLYEAVFN